MQLSQNFSLEAFERSSRAIKEGINNSMPENLIPNAIALCDSVWQPTRDKFGEITESSGYRCPELNQLLGSKSSSDHLRGLALDGVPKYANIVEVFDWMRKNLEYDQIILERVDGREWIHASYRQGNNRMEAMTYDGEYHAVNDNEE